SAASLTLIRGHSRTVAWHCVLTPAPVGAAWSRSRLEICVEASVERIPLQKLLARVDPCGDTAGSGPIGGPLGVADDLPAALGQPLAPQQPEPRRFDPTAPRPRKVRRDGWALGEKFRARDVVGVDIEQFD